MKSEFQNPVSGKLKEKTFDEFIQEFDKEVHEALHTVVKRYGSTHLVGYQVLDLCSSQAGHLTAMPVGPNNTFKTMEEAAAGRLGDVPSRFAYPVFYAVVPQSE